jgi:hypothetical protein
VTGECEASIEVFNSSDSLAFGFAIAELTIGPLNQAANTTGDVLDVVGASVPNEGISGVSLGKPVQYGATPLTDTAMVALPKGGTIYDTCENGLGAPSAAGGSTVQDIDYTTPNIAAIRLGALHQTTPG